MKGKTSVSVKLNCDDTQLVRSLKRINKELDKIKNNTLVINIETLSVNKKWWQFWK